MYNMNEILKLNIQIPLKISNTIWDKRVLKNVGTHFEVLSKSLAHSARQ